MARTRKIKGIDNNAFRSDLEQCDIVKSPSCDLDALVDAYNTELRDVLDKHAPEKEKVVVPRTHTPWYTEQERQAKRERRTLPGTQSRRGRLSGRDTRSLVHRAGEAG